MLGSQLLPALQLGQAYSEQLCEDLIKVLAETPNLRPNLQDPHKNPMLGLSST